MTENLNPKIYLQDNEQCSYCYEGRECKNDAIDNVVRTIPNSDGKFISIPTCEDHKEIFLSSITNDNWMKFINNEIKENINIVIGKEKPEEIKAEDEIDRDVEEYKKQMMLYFQEQELALQQRADLIERVERDIESDRKEIGIMEKRLLILKEIQIGDEMRLKIERREFDSYLNKVE